MEFKSYVTKTDNATNLIIELPISYRDLDTVRKLEDIKVYHKNPRTERIETLFDIMDSKSVSISTNGIAMPLSRENKKIKISAQIDGSDDTTMKHFVAKVRQGLDQYLKNYEAAKEAIEKMISEVEVK